MAYETPPGDRPPVTDPVDRGTSQGLIAAITVVALVAVGWYLFAQRGADTVDRDGSAMEEPHDRPVGTRPERAPEPQEPAAPAKPAPAAHETPNGR